MLLITVDSGNLLACAEYEQVTRLAELTVTSAGRHLYDGCRRQRYLLLPVQRRHDRFRDADERNSGRGP